MDDGSGSRRTILQDIFGKSAILSATSRNIPSRVTPLLPSAAKVAAPRDLELPPYEQPPLPRLFDALMGRIIGKRALDVPPISNDADAMDVDDATHVEAVSALPASVEEEPGIGQDELDALTTLFRKALSSRTCSHFSRYFLELTSVFSSLRHVGTPRQRQWCPQALSWSLETE